jgi:hypothetical protein
LNRYAYVLSNPLIGIDPFGLECVFISDDGNSIEEVDPTDGTDHSSGTDSASCYRTGGLYFEGNNEVNYDNVTQDGGNWARFDLDPDSNWVSLTDDNGNPVGQFNCRDGCGMKAFASFFNAEVSGVAPGLPQMPHGLVSALQWAAGLPTPKTLAEALHQTICMNVVDAHLSGRVAGFVGASDTVFGAFTGGSTTVPFAILGFTGAVVDQGATEVNDLAGCFQ